VKNGPKKEKNNHREKTMESINNLQILCEKHGPKPQSRFNSWDPKNFIGHHVKVSFKIDNPISPSVKTEHMWVKIHGKRKTELIGILDNYPVYTDLIKFGDEITLSINNIEAVLGKNGELL